MSGTHKLKIYTDHTNTNLSVKENWTFRRQKGYKECFKRADNSKDHYRRKGMNNLEEK